MAKLCSRFLVLMAARSGEATGALLEEVDFDGEVWAIPGDRMKRGEFHRVPLSRQAVEVLEHARALRDGSGLVFPSPMAHRPVSTSMATTSPWWSASTFGRMSRS